MEHNQHESHHDSHHIHNSTVSKLKGHAGALEAWLLPSFEKLPHLPENWKNVIVKIVPWLSLIFGILSIIGLLGAGFFGILLSPIIALSRGFLSIILFVSILLSLITSIFSILAFKPLQQMKKIGWDYSFYAFVISAISALLGMITPSNSIASIVGILISAYVIFEVRGKYHL
jgi:hypothetical protein